ncbi:MAG: hypothetical protein AB7I41_19170 [Candidatus Sericytochromatia bacterium]
MKHRSLSLLLSSLLLTACGNNAMTGAYNPYGQAGYGQQPGYGQAAYGQAAYGQTLTGQSAYQPGYAASVYGQTGQTGMTGYADPYQQMNPAMNGYGAPQQGYATQPGTQTGYANQPTGQTGYTSTSPTTAPTKTTTTPKTTVPAKATTAPKTTTPTKTTATTQVAQFLSNARQAMDKLQSLSATIANFEKGTQPGQGKIQYYYRKPGQVKIDVIQSSDPSRKGVKLSYQTSSDQVRARATGLLSLVPVTLPMSDAKVKSGRGYLIGQIDLTATVTRLTQPSASVKVLGKTTQNGAEIIVLEVKTQNHFDNRITKEHLGLDSKTWLPRLHEMYVGSELVYAAKLEQMEVNPTLASNVFDV